VSIEVGDAIEKIKGRPPIEYLRKLAPSPEEAARYLKDMETAKLAKLSDLGKKAQRFEVYVPLLGAKLAYGLPGINELIEWQEAGFDLGEKPVIDPKTHEVTKPGREGRPVDQVKAMRKIAYVLLRKADPELTEETVGEMDAPALTQFIVAAGEHTPFLATQQPAAASPSPSTPKN
jgi:hypothetical protein